MQHVTAVKIGGGRHYIIVALLLVSGNVTRSEPASFTYIVLSRGDRGWLSHGLVVTLPISYSLDGGTLWGFTRDMRIAD